MSISYRQIQLRQKSVTERITKNELSRSTGVYFAAIDVIIQNLRLIRLIYCNVSNAKAARWARKRKTAFD